MVTVFMTKFTRTKSVKTGLMRTTSLEWLSLWLRFSCQHSDHEGDHLLKRFEMFGLMRHEMLNSPFEMASLGLRLGMQLHDERFPGRQRRLTFGHGILMSCIEGS